jgi:hypothetical protein
MFWVGGTFEPAQFASHSKYSDSYVDSYAFEHR